MKERVFLYAGALCLGLTFIGFGINSWSARPAGGGAVRPAEDTGPGGTAFTDIDLNDYRLYFDYTNDPDTWIEQNTTSDTARWVVGNTTAIDITEAADDLINVYTFRLASSTNALNLGTAAATGHSLTTGDVLAGGDLEVDGMIYGDGGVTTPDGSPVAAGNMRINNAELRFATGPNLIYSVDRVGAEASREISLYTGDAGNVGDYDTGFISIFTGDTTTDGNTGTISIYTGAAGAGAADAGDILMAVNGAPGAGTDVLQATGSAGAITMAKLKQEDAAATCTVGEIVLDNATTIELCYCQATNTWYCVALAAGPAD